MGYNQALWYSGGVVIPDINQAVFYALWYHRSGRKDLKVPGGSQKNVPGRNDQTPEQTLMAELIGDRELLERGSIIILGTIKRPAGPNHTKYFYPATPGEDAMLRSTEKIDQEDGMPDETLSVPFLIDVEDFYTHAFTARAHREMVPELMRLMAMKSEAWGWKARKMKLI